MLQLLLHWVFSNGCLWIFDQPRTVRPMAARSTHMHDAPGMQVRHAICSIQQARQQLGLHNSSRQEATDLQIIVILTTWWLLTKAVKGCKTQTAAFQTMHCATTCSARSRERGSRTAHAMLPAQPPLTHHLHPVASLRCSPNDLEAPRKCRIQQSAASTQLKDDPHLQVCVQHQQQQQQQSHSAPSANSYSTNPCNSR